MRSFIIAFAVAIVSPPSWAGFWQIDYDDNRRKRDVTTVVLGGNPAELSVIGIADSTRYWEVVLGKSFKIAEAVSIIPHVGYEGLSGASPRVRFLVLTSASIGKLRFTGVNEFAGNTGNFHKQVLQMDLNPRMAVGLTRHSSAGFGPRFDFQVTPKTAMQLQYLKGRGDDRRLTFTLTGAF